MRDLSALKVFSVFLVLIVSLSCSEGDDTKIVKMRVNHYVQPCTPFEMQRCPQMLVQEGSAVGSDHWTQLYSIAGFEFAPGYTYDLMVERKEAEKSGKNRSDYDPRPSYTVKEIVSKTKVSADETFEIWLSYGLLTVGESDIQINDGPVIDCASLCDQLSEKINAGVVFTAVFKHADANTIQLVGIKE